MTVDSDKSLFKQYSTQFLSGMSERMRDSCSSSHLGNVPAGVLLSPYFSTYNDFQNTDMHHVKLDKYDLIFRSFLMKVADQVHLI